MLEETRDLHESALCAVGTPSSPPTIDSIFRSLRRLRNARRVRCAARQPKCRRWIEHHGVLGRFRNNRKPLFVRTPSTHPAPAKRLRDDPDGGRWPTAPAPRRAFRHQTICGIHRNARYRQSRVIPTSKHRLPLCGSLHNPCWSYLASRGIQPHWLILRLSSFSNSASVRIVTPSSLALSYFEPGSVPTTT